ncbi:Putative esterase, FIGfam005057 [hydrothermal vent metagenome]|uniref:Putative esterase, FIGfam005057 n=1 Tax=hydrothermal vent metagenome TaxID=652676 RepID=A0A1W1D166_9ZZZZ
MIIYIHGFGSSGLGGKSSQLREYFNSKNIPFIAPSLSYIPNLALETLEELILSYNQEITLIGSSLGGYYTLYLSQKYRLKAVLINPSIKPYKTLKPYVGDAPSFYDESSFKWTNTHIKSLKSYKISPKKQKRLMLMLQKGDETLDYQKAVDFLPKAKHIIEENGNHSFEGIERYFEKIEAFLVG